MSERTNYEKERYAVAVKRAGVIVGHLPKKISRMCALRIIVSQFPGFNVY